MRQLLKERGLKMTPQRDIVFRAFFDMGRHVTVDELYDRVRQNDNSVSYSTVWRNIKLICTLGLAEEVNLGDGVTRYDRVTDAPHGHLYCLRCRELFEFEADSVLDFLTATADRHDFAPRGFKLEIQGLCSSCRLIDDKKKPGGLK